VVAEVAINGACPPVHTIEVELTPKHLAKLGQVFEARYPGEVQTTYFTHPATRTASDVAWRCWSRRPGPATSPGPG
jgi:hypothetical protein